MCLGCWEENGKPWLLTAEVERWAPIFGKCDHFGACHIIIDDWNLDDDAVSYCLDKTSDQTEEELCIALLSMSIGERWATAIRSEQPDFKP